jgi:hypothetical protein
MSAHRKSRQSDFPERLRAQRATELVCCACLVPVASNELRCRNVVGLGPTPLCAACSEDIGTIDAMLQRLTSRCELNG